MAEFAEFHSVIAVISIYFKEWYEYAEKRSFQVSPDNPVDRQRTLGGGQHSLLKRIYKSFPWTPWLLPQPERQ